MIRIRTKQKTNARATNISGGVKMVELEFDPDKLNLTKIKQRSTAEPVLEALRKEHPLPKLIFDYNIVYVNY